MISHDSRSKTPPPPPAPISTRLAPGFRFHPTDEELVSYYLRRKVAGQPLRVNAISEVDLYKTEPWDLPPQSVLRTRDLEWYFFTALDRKYSNRSRTNRATEEGYWKTTGKDRPVQRRSRKIGMKKTLVYHAGRAPHGQRTNWVMHEYRLEDDDPSHSSIPQDGYVLCRIFQKSGPGPQNGAQYGAPFEEEEWERDEEEEADIVSGNAALISCEDFVHLADFSENQDTANQHSDATPLVAKSAEQGTASMAENSSIPMDEILKDKVSVKDFSANVDCPALQENISILNGVRENSIVEDQSSTQNNGYVQLNDIVDDESTCFTSDGHSNDCENLPTKPSSSFIIDQTADQHAMHVEPYGLPDDVPWVYASSPQLAEANLMYYDALGHDVQYLETSFPNEDSLVPRAGFDFLEDLMAYYDATDDTLHYANANSFIPECVQVNPSHLVESSSSAESDCTSSLGAVSVQENAAKSASLVKTSNITSSTGGSSDKFSAGIRNEDLEDKTLMKRLASVLESISAPPAFAAEPAATGKLAGHFSSASTSSFHVTGMIQIRNLTDMRCSASLALPKYCGPSFLFSYAVDGKVAAEALLHEPLKFQSGFFSSFFRGSFHSFFLPVLMLALSYRVMAYAFRLCA